MVVLGGLGLRMLAPDTPRDSWTNGINVFDLSSMRWKDSYQADGAPYHTPSIVMDWYAQYGPHPTWDSPVVESLLVGPSTVTTVPSPNSSNPSPPPSDENRGRGAIMGGIIGWAALTAMIAGVGY